MIDVLMYITHTMRQGTKGGPFLFVLNGVSFGVLEAGLKGIL